MEVAKARGADIKEPEKTAIARKRKFKETKQEERKLFAGKKISN